jgi:hypothetical protein
VTRQERIAEARLEQDLERNRDRARNLRQVLDALHGARSEKAELAKQLKASAEDNKSLRLRVVTLRPNDGSGDSDGSTAVVASVEEAEQKLGAALLREHKLKAVVAMQQGLTAKSERKLEALKTRVEQHRAVVEAGEGSGVLLSDRYDFSLTSVHQYTAHGAYSTHLAMAGMLRPIDGWRTCRRR